MENLIAIVVIAALVIGAIVYIVHAKKKGARCIGCPAAGTSKCHCNDFKKSY